MADEHIVEMRSHLFNALLFYFELLAARDVQRVELERYMRLPELDFDMQTYQKMKAEFDRTISAVSESFLNLKLGIDCYVEELKKDKGVSNGQRKI